MMANTDQKHPSKSKILVVFILTIIIGYALFILPDIFFGITKINGGKTGINLLFIALFQFASIVFLLFISLNILKKDFKFIGLEFSNLKRDILFGLIFGFLWTALQFVLIIPNTGGANRDDIIAMLTMYDGSLTGTIAFIALGVIGGGITEEIFNRGYFINTLKCIFKNPKTGTWVSAILSIIVFSIGHMPTDNLAWFDILVPTIMYTLLFLTTKRLTASIVAHGIYNMSAILLTFYIYYP
ncbi:CPBP family intramembrane glutamic endopeptidase [Gelidibacter sp. F63206]|uniref:CPBP family intramembrane glutamic endopeptidase n=1 Tax=Gelidibacter sp. F63206 TaxID=2926425 RepID=UPI001FF2BD5C|nr:type II CAAX endopeptidase family protein [Gelidibacter sp. F63206]MCK0114419.1 CPBP family intramembrane metalloprotease [Gelidibacter sp. F63206]